MAGKLQTGENLRSALPADALATAPSNGGFALSTHDLNILSVENIGGIRVVEESVAVRLARALAVVLIRHAEYRLAQFNRQGIADGTEEWKLSRNRATKAQRRYKAARNAAMRLLVETTGSAVTVNTTIPP